MLKFGAGYGLKIRPALAVCDRGGRGGAGVVVVCARCAAACEA